MEYKRGDRVAIIGTITHSEDEFGNLGIDLPNGDYLRRALKTNEVTHLEDFHPDEKEIKMTVDEKREFDELVKTVFHDHQSNVYKIICTLVESNNYPALNVRVAGSFEKQMELLECVRKPSRIEVEEKKYRIKLADGYLVNVMGDWLTLKNKQDGDIFTQSEIDELQKQEQFKAIDLNKCKEEVEDE
jgi:hypothetical protein